MIILRIAIVTLFFCSSAWASSITEKQWPEIVAASKGQTVYFNGWGGSEAVNDYVLWASRECQKRYGFEVKHVKVTDISEVVSRILAEKTVGRIEGGSVDLMWINGENFYAMKKSDLLMPAYAHILPNSSLIDYENKPSTLYDFTVPVDGLEVPWGMAQLVFIHDTEKVATPPRNMKELLEFAKKNPAKFTYPAPPAFDGTTFLKQILLELAVDKDALQRPVDKVVFDKMTEPLWKFLDELHPLMWRKGQVFVPSSHALLNLLDNSEVYIAFNFNPNEPSRAVENGELPESVRSYVHDGGTLANSHFIAVPFNANAPEAALVFANFLVSPEAQARKNDPQYWGDPTVLALGKLTAKEREYFDEVEIGPASLSVAELGVSLPEPHASWVRFLEEAWRARYSQ